MIINGSYTCIAHTPKYLCQLPGEHTTQKKDVIAILKVWGFFASFFLKKLLFGLKFVII